MLHPITCWTCANKGKHSKDCRPGNIAWCNIKKCVIDPDIPSHCMGYRSAGTVSVSDLQSSRYHLTTDSQEIAAILDAIGRPEQSTDYGALLFALDRNDDYTEVWQCAGSIPYTWRDAIRIL